MTMVEFTLVAPMFLALLWGMVVIGLVVTNFVQVTNVARAGARVAAICADKPPAPPPTMPDGSGQPCSSTAVEAYMNSQLFAIPAPLTPSITVCSQTTGGSCGTLYDPTSCSQGSIVQVNLTYQQPLYFPIVESLFQSPGSDGTRKITAQAQATCE